MRPLEKPAYYRVERLTWDAKPLEKRVHRMQKQEDWAKVVSDWDHPALFLVCFFLFLSEGEEKVMLCPQSNMAETT